MQFIGMQGELLRCLQTVEKAVATRDTSPALTGVYMECEDGRLVVRASDSELTIEAHAQVEVAREGNVILEAKFFIPLIRRLPAGEVIVKFLPEQQMLEIAAGNGNFRLQTMVAEEFPKLDISGREPLANLPSHLLAKMIKQTVYATRKEQGHSAFTGILMECSSNEIRLVATDSSRLCFNRQGIPQGNDFRFIVPARTCSELLRILPSEEEAFVEISLLGNQVVFSLDDAIVVSRLLEGQYPDYNRVIPKGTDVEIVALCSELAAALERANLMGKKGPAIVTFDLEEGLLNLRSRDPDLGESKEILNVEHTGDGVKSSFQARFVLEMLRTVESDKVTIGLSNGLNPGIIRPEDSEDYLYVIMPVRTV
ncbi:MAG: DNA polymerase III subunit beta [Firmicutes bacterium]|nr:DNA polymerase III subunit beta [Bacillota bacterium]